MARCFFHALANFCGKKPRYWAVRFVSCDIGVVLHVFSMVCEFFCIMMSSELQAFCHWVSVR